MPKDMAVSMKDAITSNRGRNEGLFTEGKAELPAKTKKQLFVSPHQKQGFKVPVRGEDGKVIMAINNATGRPHLLNGRPVPVLRDCNFLTQSNNVKRGCLSYFETDDPDEIVVLTELANQGGNEILTEEMYLKGKDPGAYEMKKKLDAKEAEVAALQNESSTKGDIIAELEKQIAQLTAPGKGK